MAFGINMGYTEFHMAAWFGNKSKVVEKLNQEDFDFDVPTKDGNTPLALAAHGGRFDVFHMLLERGANIHNADHDLDTPLHYAVSNKHLKMAKKLIEYGADVNVKNKYGTTPLWTAVYACDLKMMKLLLFHYADMSVCAQGCKLIRQFGSVYDVPRTLLYVAVDKQSTECISVLLGAGYCVYKEKWLHHEYYPWKNESNCGAKDSEEFERTFSLLKDLSTKPPTLLTQCRTFLRQHLGKQLTTNIDEMVLPKHIKTFLTLSDLCDSILNTPHT